MSKIREFVVLELPEMVAVIVLYAESSTTGIYYTFVAI